jgi:hypothetical protein
MSLRLVFKGNAYLSVRDGRSQEMSWWTNSPALWVSRPKRAVFNLRYLRITAR